MKLLTHIPSWIKSKYFIAFAAFCVVVLFLDKNDFFTQIDRQKELRELQQSRQYYSTSWYRKSPIIQRIKNYYTIRQSRPR